MTQSKEKVISHRSIQFKCIYSPSLKEINKGSGKGMCIDLLVRREVYNLAIIPMDSLGISRDYSRIPRDSLGISRDSLGIHSL